MRKSEERIGGVAGAFWGFVKGGEKRNGGTYHCEVVRKGIEEIGMLRGLYCERE